MGGPDGAAWWDKVPAKTARLHETSDWGFDTACRTVRGRLPAYRVDEPDMQRNPNESAPPAYGDLAAFNRALAAFCVDNPTLVFNSPDYSSKGGYHTAPFRKHGVQGVAGDLIDAIEACVVTYANERPPVAGHPFLGQRPETCEIVIWGVVLPRGGYENSHIHREAWLSGVYYPQAPAILQHAESDQRGWIEFGQAQPYPKATAPSVIRRYPPVEGTLYVFPSYFYHRTIPFDADVQRISIAFDMVPTPPP